MGCASSRAADNVLEPVRPSLARKLAAPGLYRAHQMNGSADGSASVGKKHVEWAARTKQTKKDQIRNESVSDPCQTLENG